MRYRPAGESPPERRPLIAVVGPCASGKSALVNALRERGYNAREVCQEHSSVPAMWQRITQPDLLIYLDVSQVVAGQRRAAESKVTWWDKLTRRLRHARENADLRIDTDDLRMEEVLSTALAFLRNRTG